MHRRTFTAAAVAGLATLQPAQAQELTYPSRPVRVIIGFPPGGGVDLNGRPLLRKLEDRLRQPVVVDNRPGANGNIALEAAARAAPDGYTLFYGNGGNLAVNQALYANLPFDTLRDFVPVAQSAVTSLVVTVPAALPVRNLTELLDYARARPGELNFGSGGNGGSSHLAFEALKRRAGVEIEHVPYRGSAPALQDLLGGRIQLMIDAYNLSRGAVEAGALRVLAVTSPGRSAALPEVPAAAESAGLEGFESQGWHGIVAPAGTPPAVVARLEEAVRWAVTETDLPRTYLDQGVQAHFAPSGEFRSLIARERERYATLIREANIRLD